MAEVRVKGQGSRAEAARLGQDIAAGTAAALSGHAPRHIDTLRISLPAGAGKAEIEHAVQKAVAAQGRGGK